MYTTNTSIDFEEMISIDEAMLADAFGGKVSEGMQWRAGGKTGKWSDYQGYNDAISILRGISIRIPLLIYGADFNDDTKIITIQGALSTQVITLIFMNF